MSSPMVNRSSGLRRPTTETKRTSGNEVTPSLAATTALQEYLASDIDAKSRIPCPRPASGPVGKRQGNAKPTQLDVRVGINAENADTPKGVVSRAESPLSRFQKHMKQTHSVPDQRHILLLSTTIPPRGNYHDFQRTAGAPASESAQSLTRSLMDKINEAKSLQQTEAASRGRSKHSSEPEILSRGLQSSIDLNLLEGSRSNSVYTPKYQPNLKSTPPVPSTPIQERPPDAAPPATTVLNNSPPVPHVKPVMPMIPQLAFSASPKKLTLETQHGQETNEKPSREPKEATSTINDVIVATNAVLSIQHMWRQSRRKSKEHNTEVMLIIDKSCDDNITPLFRAAKARCGHVTKQMNDASIDNELVDSSKGSYAKSPRPSQPSYYPWTDHELIFLEEGRCIGELQDAVHRGNSVDQDELVWKRPQQVIQQQEAQRVSMTQKTRRKRGQNQSIPSVDPNVEAPDPIVNGTSEMMSSVPRIEHAVAISTNTKPNEERMIQRKLPRGYRLKLKNTGRKSVLRATKGSAKLQKLFVHVLRGTGTHEACDHAEPTCTSNKGETEREGTPDPPHIVDIDVKQADSTLSDLAEIEVQRNLRLTSDRTLTLDPDSRPGVFGRFVVSSGSALTSNGVDTKLPHHDLISVGDLALARSLLYAEHHGQTTINQVEHHNDLIPLTLPSPSIYASGSSTLSEVLPGQPVSMRDPPPIAETNPTGRYGDECAYARSATGHVALQVQDNGRPSQEPEDQEPKDMVRRKCSLAWGELLMEGSRTRSDDSASCTSSPSNGNNSSIESRAVDKAVDILPQHCSTDPMCALHVITSSFTETVARIHSDEHDNQQTEAAPSSQHPIPVAQPSRLRLDEEKRIEFLRVLNDFKRCLRPPSSCSSSVLLSTTSASTSSKYEAPMVTETVNRDPGVVDVAKGQV
ncbi:hypothetical protein PI124_g13830 [Phytophthora idaei]|nr:hypothetical protein PI124_g13830 [Phytophthora idaei]